MFTRMKQKLNGSNIAIWVIIISITFPIYSCSLKPQSLKILASKPMGNTVLECYPAIEKVYESDDEILAVSSWGKVPKSENHKLKWEIVNKEGKYIYTNSNENVIIHPYMYISQPIRIDKITKDDLQAGMYTVNFYFDDKLVKSQNVQYVPESIINKNVQGAVILPFSIKSLQTAFTDSQDELLSNTISFAIYSEVKRIIPYTVPHFVAQQNLGTFLRTDCFNNKDCASWVEDKFDEEIFITGNIELGKYVISQNSITVYVYHTKTKAIDKFYYNESGGKESYVRIIQALLKGVMYKEGLLDYLKSM